MQKLLQVEGEKDGDELGWSVSGLGDINGDGYADVIVGARTTNGDVGYAYILFGGEQMDNLPDIIVRGEHYKDFFGRASQGSMDLNGDGFNDFTISAPGYPEVWDDSLGYFRGLAMGKVYIYFGGDELDSVVDFTLMGEEEEDLFGSRISGAGDVNGDGYDDLITPTKIRSERVVYYIFHGGAQLDRVPDWIWISEGRAGFVAGAGDVNGDGYSDVIISGEPYARIFFGGVAMDTIPDVILYEGTSKHTVISRGPVSTAGDVNGDGFSDVIVAAGTHGPTRKVYLYFGGAEMDSLADVVMVGDSLMDRSFGSSLACAGDVNGDGYDDVIIGDWEAYGYLGWVQLFLGGPNMDGKPDLILIGRHGGADFGASVASAGDVNGDGFDDIIVGAPAYWYHQDYRGRAIIYAGNGNLTSVKEIQPAPIQRPEYNALYQNYPNPFNHHTVIRYSVSSMKQPTLAKLGIYDILGEEVRILVSKHQQTGTYEVVWNGTDETGKEVTSGIYYYELKVGEFRDVKKMALVR
jgi:hypothetical protein